MRVNRQLSDYRLNTRPIRMRSEGGTCSQTHAPNTLLMDTPNSNTLTTNITHAKNNAHQKSSIPHQHTFYDHILNMLNKSKKAQYMIVK